LTSLLSWTRRRTSCSTTEDDLIAYREDRTERQDKPDASASWKRRRALIKRWLLTYPHQLKEKYEAEFQAVHNKSATAKAAERDIDTLRA
jgi:hypothetical protein